MNKKAFTLAETLITLTILGVVAAITVPSLINKQSDSANRTKIKKAMAVYEKALNQMIIDNDIKGETGLAALNDSTCSKTYEYFKIVEKLNNSTNCEFKTADRVYWNISDIQHPIISTKEQDRNDTTSDNTFILAGYYDENDILRINDLGAAKDTNKTNLKKVYEFVLNKTLEDGDSCPDCILGSPYTSLDEFSTCQENKLYCYDNGRDIYFFDGFMVSGGYGDGNHRHQINATDSLGNFGLDGYYLDGCESLGTNCATCESANEPCPTPDANGKYTAARTVD